MEHETHLKLYNGGLIINIDTSLIPDQKLEEAATEARIKMFRHSVSINTEDLDRIIAMLKGLQAFLKNLENRPDV